MAFLQDEFYGNEAGSIVGGIPVAVGCVVRCHFRRRYNASRSAYLSQNDLVTLGRHLGVDRGSTLSRVSLRNEFHRWTLLFHHNDGRTSEYFFLIYFIILFWISKVRWIILVQFRICRIDQCSSMFSNYSIPLRGALYEHLIFAWFDHSFIEVVITKW